MVPDRTAGDRRDSGEVAMLKPACGMLIDGTVIDLNTHLGRALEEHAKAPTKPVEDLTGQERSQAFCSYILSGKHLEDK